MAEIRQTWKDKSPGHNHTKCAKTLKDEATCLVPMNLESEIVTNENPNPTVKVAPGQGKQVTSFMRQEHFDLQAFPRHHPSGINGLHHSRKQKLSAQKYFIQRIMNYDERFSTDLSYIFMAQQYVERQKLESQVSLAGRKGKIQNQGAQKVGIW